MKIDTKIRLIAKYEIRNNGTIKNKTLKDKINKSGLIKHGVSSQKVQKTVKTMREFKYDNGEWKIKKRKGFL